MTDRKIPRQRTGSGGWPDRRGSSDYGSRKRNRGGCLSTFIVGMLGVTGILYGLYAIGARLFA